MDLVHQLRREKGWSQEHLAHASGLSRATVQRIEKGQVRPDADTLLSLAAALGVDPARIRQASGLAAVVVRVMTIVNARTPTEKELRLLPVAERKVFADFVSARSDLDAVVSRMDEARVRDSAEHEEYMRLSSECSAASAAVSASPRDPEVWRAYDEVYARMKAAPRQRPDDAVALCQELQEAMVRLNQRWLALSMLLLRFL